MEIPVEVVAGAAMLGCAGAAALGGRGAAAASPPNGRLTGRQDVNGNPDTQGVVGLAVEVVGVGAALMGCEGAGAMGGAAGAGGG